MTTTRGERIGTNKTTCITCLSGTHEALICLLEIAYTDDVLLELDTCICVT